MRKKKLSSRKSIKAIEKPPHDPRQCTVVDILREKVRHRDVRAMTVLGLYYAYGIGGRKLQYHAARLFYDAYLHTNDINSKEEIQLLARRLIDIQVLMSVDVKFATEDIPDEICAGWGRILRDL